MSTLSKCSLLITTSIKCDVVNEVPAWLSVRYLFIKQATPQETRLVKKHKCKLFWHFLITADCLARHTKILQEKLFVTKEIITYDKAQMQSSFSPWSLFILLSVEAIIFVFKGEKCGHSCQSPIYNRWYAKFDGNHSSGKVHTEETKNHTPTMGTKETLLNLGLCQSVYYFVVILYTSSCFLAHLLCQRKCFFGLWCATWIEQYNDYRCAPGIN